MSDSMSKKITNFFEVSITPQIDALYLTEGRFRAANEIKDNLIVNNTKDSVISLYPLPGSSEMPARLKHIIWLVRKLLLNALERSDSIFDIDRKGEFTILDDKLAQTNEYSILWRVIMRVFNAQDLTGQTRLLLSVDPITKLYNRLSIDKLVQSHGFQRDDFLRFDDCLVFVEKRRHRKWARGRIRDYEDSGNIKVEVPYLFDGTIQVSANRVVPSLPQHILASIVRDAQPNLDLYQQKKQLSSLTARKKKELIQTIFSKYINVLFPIQVRGTNIELSANPITADNFPTYQLSSQEEPEYVIERDGFQQVRDKRRLIGLSKVSIKSNIKEQKVVLFATGSSIGSLENVISKLNDGVTSGNYTFSLQERFGIKLVETDRFIFKSCEDYLDGSDSFLLSTEEKHQDALPLIYLPLRSDIYYPFKAKLAYYGKVSQVVSQPSMDIYGLWNLSTNIYAKLGYHPWGISENPKSPNADIVLGFAYSSLKESGRLKRNIGYVNVFDRNGVWLFMQSASTYLDFQNRARIIPQMMRRAILSYSASGNQPRIIDIHYSKRFSYEERKKSLEAITAIVPEVEEVNFISIDHTHPLRVFDESSPSFNLKQGSIVQLVPGEFLLSVSQNASANAPATRLLKVRVWRESTPAEDIDIESIAYRILAMTKLNWRSAVRETSEPVTLKYAEEIARLTNHFNLTEWAEINNQLSKVPWFI